MKEEHESAPCKVGFSNTRSYKDLWSLRLISESLGPKKIVDCFYQGYYVHTRPKWGSQKSHNSQFPMFEDKTLVKSARPSPRKHSLELCLYIYTPSDYQDVPLWTLCLKMFLRECHHSLQARSIPTVSAPDNRSNTLWSCRTCSELRQSPVEVASSLFTHIWAWYQVVH